MSAWSSAGRPAGSWKSIIQQSSRQQLLGITQKVFGKHPLTHDTPRNRESRPPPTQAPVAMVLGAGAGWRLEGGYFPHHFSPFTHPALTPKSCPTFRLWLAYRKWATQGALQGQGYCWKGDRGWSQGAVQSPGWDVPGHQWRRSVHTTALASAPHRGLLPPELVCTPLVGAAGLRGWTP